MYIEEDLLPLSAVQHIVFCPRQCALIHIEQLWFENRYTAEGRILHERADSNEDESRGDTRIVRAMPMRSLRLGLSGKADVVEFQRISDHVSGGSVRWRPFPVEYKRGRPKKDDSDCVQLCAQALCLEEMLEVEISSGALFYGKPRRRQAVVFDRNLRDETRKAAEDLHGLFESKITPPPVYNQKCDSCSFFDHCMPKTLAKRRSVEQYLQSIIGAQ